MQSTCYLNIIVFQQKHTQMLTAAGNSL